MICKKFRHPGLPSWSNYVQAERVDGGQFRLYKTPEGDLFPSVTSVLGVIPNPGLEAWKARVGAEEAERVSRIATVRGTRIHLMCEDYLNNRFKEEDYSIFHLAEWLPLKNVMDRDIDDVVATELQMFSKRLRSAGTTDLIASFKGRPSLIDFKTSKRLKHRDDIQGYFIQGAAYCAMAYEQLGITLKDIVILINVDDDDVQVFEARVEDYLPKYVELRTTFKRLHSI